MRIRVLAVLAVLGFLAVAAAPAGAMDIILGNADFSVTYCDGFHLENLGAGVSGDKIFFGSRTGCVNAVAMGMMVKNRLGRRRWGINTTDGNFLPNWYYVIRSNRTWALYDAAGTHFRSGRWKPGLVAGAPGAGASSVASTD